MKILHIINSLNIGGAEKLIVDITPQLLKRGYEIEVLLLNDSKTSFKRDLLSRNIPLHSLTNNSIYNPLLIFKIIPFLRRFDIVHVHLFPAQYWVAIAKFISFSNVKLVTTEHNTSNRRRNIPLLKLFDLFVYKQYHVIISISRDTENMLQKYLVYNIAEFIVIENGINVESFVNSTAILSEHLIGQSKVSLIVMVAAFRDQKDQDTLIKSMQLVSRDIHLMLVGDGNRRAQCEQLVDNLNLKDRVHFLGIRSDVKNILKSADIVVMSSHYEGFGLAAVEGMAVGKPVIVSNVPGLSGVVRGAGLLFEKGNYIELAQHINHLLDDKVFYETVANACLNRSKKFDLSRMLDAYENVYNKVFNK